MRYKVLTSFSGLIHGTKGGIIDIPNPGIAKDLLKAGYVEKIVEAKKPVPKKPKIAEGDDK